MRDVFKKRSNFIFTEETKETSVNYDSVWLLVDKIVDNEKELNSETDAENVVELINSPDSELAISDLLK